MNRIKWLWKHCRVTKGVTSTAAFQNLITHLQQSYWPLLLHRQYFFRFSNSENPVDPHAQTHTGAGSWSQGKGEHIPVPLAFTGCQNCPPFLLPPGTHSVSSERLFVAYPHQWRSFEPVPPTQVIYLLTKHNPRQTLQAFFTNHKNRPKNETQSKRTVCLSSLALTNLAVLLQEDTVWPWETSLGIKTWHWAPLVPPAPPPKMRSLSV